MFDFAVERFKSYFSHKIGLDVHVWATSIEIDFVYTNDYNF
jgi:hypothetical protein